MAKVFNSGLVLDIEGDDAEVYRCERLATHAVGRNISICIRKRTATQSGITVYGKIEKCEFIGFRARSLTAIAQFRVRVNNDSYVVERLPF